MFKLSCSQKLLQICMGYKGKYDSESIVLILRVESSQAHKFKDFQ